MAPLTRSQKRKMAIGLHSLPSALLVTIGTFLSTSESLVVSRTCKTNEWLLPFLESVSRAKIVTYGESGVAEIVSALMACSRLKYLKHSSFQASVSLLQPLLSSRIGSALRAFEVACSQNKDIAELAKLLPYLESLQEFSFSKGGWMLSSTIMRQVLLKIPRTVHSLLLKGLSGGLVKALGTVMADDGFPLLENLALPFMSIDWMDEAAPLICALTKPSVGKVLKSLYLDVSDCSLVTDAPWTLVEALLGLNVEDVRGEILPILRTLILAGFCEWERLGNHLLKGRLDKLIEVRSVDVEDKDYGYGHGFEATSFQSWFECDIATTRLWFRLLRHRPSLQPFSSLILFLAERDGPADDEVLMHELLMGLSEPLNPKATCFIKEMDLKIDDSRCSTLAAVIKFGNLRSVESFKLFQDERCSSTSFAALGAVLTEAFLPCLTSWSLGVDEQLEASDEDFQSLKAFFSSIPPGGLRKVNKVSFGCLYDYGSVGTICRALAELKLSFRYLKSLEIWGVTGDDEIEDICTAFEAGVFPVESVEFEESGVGEWPTRPGIFKRLVRALSNVTRARELTIRVEREDQSRFLVPLLKALRTFLSESQAASFLSLEKIQVDYCRDNMKKRDASIRASLRGLNATRPGKFQIILNDVTMVY